eukprot:PhM_4_TR7949/c0_g1_i2/m.7110/K02987/RP-S4e, RPS4; small subunit ribosomal protein S4e
MARGPKKHLKRLYAPSSWMLSKLKGVYAPRPRAGPHKLRECIPLVVLLRNRLKLALNARESSFILKKRNVKVDNRIRTDPKYPCGFMDVVSIPKTKDLYRILLDSKGRFAMVRIDEAESNMKLCKVVKRQTLTNRTPAIVTHDGRTIRYADPSIAAGDSVVLDTAENKIRSFIKFRAGALAMTTGGKNMGRVGTVVDVERHPGAFNIVHIRDAADNTFATRESNVFIVGNEESLVTLPRDQGVRKNVLYERELRLENAEKAKKKASSGKQRRHK